MPDVTAAEFEKFRSDFVDQVQLAVLGPKVNALGQPSPGRTDFKSWGRETLEQFARQAADENLVLRTDLKAALDAYRKLVIQMEVGQCKASK